MSRYGFILVLGTLALARPLAVPAATSYPLTIANGLGGTITLPQRPERIISLAPNVTEILFAIGAGPRVVGVTRFCNYPPEAQKRKKTGGFTDIQFETVLMLKPDLIIASRGNPRPNIDRLAEQGLTVVGIEPQSIGELHDAISFLGQVTGNRAGAERVIGETDRVLGEVKKALAGAKTRPRVYFGGLKGPYFAAGTNSFIGRCIEVAGGDNIARGPQESWPILSMETILKRNPEVVIVGLYGNMSTDTSREKILARLRSDRVWSQISAVQTGRVHALDNDAVHRAGPRTAQIVAEMARLFYPERFPANGSTKPE